MSGEYKYRFTWPTHPGVLNGLYRDDGDRYVRECGAHVCKADIERCGITVSVDWDGTGLPPVGTVCEWLMDHDELWKTVEIRYLSKHTILCAMRSEERDDPEFALSPDGQIFRPLRTPEQIAADERSTAIVEMVRDMMVGLVAAGNGDFERAEKLYSAGYRKQVTDRV